MIQFTDTNILLLIVVTLVLYLIMNSSHEGFTTSLAIPQHSISIPTDVVPLSNYSVYPSVDGLQHDFNNTSTILKRGKKSDGTYASIGNFMSECAATCTDWGNPINPSYQVSGVVQQPTKKQGCTGFVLDGDVTSQNATQCWLKYNDTATVEASLGPYANENRHVYYKNNLA
jgi:hypothetical protein